MNANPLTGRKIMLFADVTAMPATREQMQGAQQYGFSATSEST
jgi:hypothetical protein